MWKPLIKNDQLQPGDRLRREIALGGPLIIWSEYEITALHSHELELKLVASSNGHDFSSEPPVYTRLSRDSLVAMRVWIPDPYTNTMTDYEDWKKDNNTPVNISKLVLSEQLIVTFLGLQLKVTNPTRTTTILLACLVLLIIMIITLNIVIKMH